MKGQTLTYLVIAFAIANLVVISTLVRGEENEPIGASVEDVNYSNMNASNYIPDSTYAIAGNLSEIYINGSSATKSWHGFFGNITGVLVLEDAQNYTMYTWNSAEPQGEIYASVNNSINWATVECFNYSSQNDQWESFYNITTNDVDGINETFKFNDHPMFWVGTITISAATCNNTYTYRDDAPQYVDFVEVLLTDNASNPSAPLIFTTIIENDLDGNETDNSGYNGIPYDFQLMVAEDGQAGNDLATLYYFWVEIE
jgi:hypothetical protein